MVERLRDRGEDLEPQRLPQMYRGGIRLDDGVELHAAIASRTSPSHRVRAQSSANPPSLKGRVDHETGSGDVGTPTRPVRPHGRGPDHGLPVDGHNGMPGRYRDPVPPRFFDRQALRVGVRLSRSDYGREERIDLGPVVGRKLSDHHTPDHTDPGDQRARIMLLWWT